MANLKPGNTAPAFELADQNGGTVKLSDFIGKKLLLYFYPKADTPGCTKQACSIRDSRRDITGAGIAAVGISPDLPAKQKKFDDKYSLGFPLLSDPNHAVADSYGTWGEKVRCGKKSEGIVCSSFLIDEKGEIVQTWYEVKPEDTVPNALDALV